MSPDNGDNEDNEDSEDSDEDALREHVVDALLVLTNVGYGDLSSHIDVRVPADTPLGALLTGINEMIDALRVERARSLAFKAEIEEKLATIEAQREAIRELSLPVIEVWEGVLCLPVVGSIDSSRAARMNEVLLSVIVQKRARCAIVDITGMKMMDARTIDHFVRMAKAVRLLGAECVITGVSAAVAKRMVELGADLDKVKLRRSLRDALQDYVAAQSRAS